MPHKTKQKGNGKGKKKKKSNKVKPYSSYGKQKPTSTSRSSKRGTGSNSYGKKVSKAQSIAERNVARMMNKSKKVGHRPNKKVTKPEFKSKYN